MHAEVTGKLKQHFNNALPKHNSTTTGVSVIVVSGPPALPSESSRVWPDCSASTEAFQVKSSELPPQGSWRRPCSPFHCRLAWHGQCPPWLTPRPRAPGGELGRCQ